MLRHRWRELFGLEIRSKPRRRQPCSPRLHLEFLEDRIAPAANIAITNAILLDELNQPISSANVGQTVFIQADFITQDLPSKASYYVSYMVNGLTVDSSNITLGAGDSGTASCEYSVGAWIATPGTNQVTVSVDPAHSVKETTYADNTFSFTFNAVSPAVGQVSYTVAQMRAAYGVNSIPKFGSATADGSGQTIAIVDRGNAPTILSDLDGFDQAMSLTTTSTQSLYQQYGPATSILTVYNQNGTNITSEVRSGGDDVPQVLDVGETTMDVEWAHAIAPGAKIDLIEVNDATAGSYLQGDRIAGTLPGVSAVSNSWGLFPSSSFPADDSTIFVTPPGHTGITFLTASNDNGANVYLPYSGSPPSVGDDGYYPSTSPNVVSVGGTQLTLNNDGYGSETGWSYPAPSSFVDSEQTGPWSSQAGGFSGTYSTAVGGSSSSATWTIPVTPENFGWGTELSAIWTPSPSNATNATYTVYDGSPGSGTILGTVTIDQTKAAAGTFYGVEQFQELGVFFPTLTNGDGTLTVVLNANSANGTVVADALGSAPAWASTGGPAEFESEPSYQIPFQSTGFRTTPDVAFDASENSGVLTFQDGQWVYPNFGTSLGCPCWAALIAIANQGRVAGGGTTLNSSADPTQTLQALYSLPASDFHDVTTGYNGFFASAGYDFVTGRGSPIANVLIPDLVDYDPVNLSQSTISVNPIHIESGTTTTVTLTAKDAGGNPLTTGGLSVAFGLGAGSSRGTFSAVTDNGNGTYTAIFTGTTAGTPAIITATIDGSPDKSVTPAVEVTPGADSLAQSIVTVVPATIQYGHSATVTLTAKDASGNRETGGGLIVLFGLGAGSSSGTFSAVIDNGNGTYSAIFTGTAAGTPVTITATIGGSIVSSVLPTIMVTPVVLSIKPAKGQAEPYGSVLATPGTTYSASGFINSDGVSLLTGLLGTVTKAGSTTGTFKVGTLSAGPNYTLEMAPGSPTFTATPIALTVTDDQNKVYGAAIALTPTYIGFVNGDTAKVLKGAPVLNTSAKASSGVGTYPITLKRGTLSDPNYTFTAVNGTLTITPAALTVTAANKTIAYGAALPALTYAIAGFVNGDTSASLTTKPAITTIATSASPVGTYSLVPGAPSTAITS